MQVKDRAAVSFPVTVNSMFLRDTLSPLTPHFSKEHTTHLSHLSLEMLNNMHKKGYLQICIDNEYKKKKKLAICSNKWYISRIVFTDFCTGKKKNAYIQTAKIPDWPHLRAENVDSLEWAGGASCKCHVLLYISKALKTGAWIWTCKHAGNVRARVRVREHTHTHPDPSPLWLGKGSSATALGFCIQV